MKVTLAQFKSSDAAQAVGIPTCDDRWLPLVNQSIQRLVMSGETWWNLTYKYRISITEGLLTWPREIATIQTIASCGYSMPIRSEWFEFVSGGYGLRDRDAYCDTNNLPNPCRWDWQTFDRGMSPLFSDVVPTGNAKSIKLYSTVPESGTDYVWIFGTNAEGEPLRTNTVGDEWVEGVRALVPVNPMIPATFNDTVATITGVVKPVTNGTIHLYEYDTFTTTQRKIATYQADETVPSYRRSFIGGLCQDHPTVVTVMAKREFQPAVNDEDILLLGSIPAIKMMMLAVRKLDQGIFAESEVYEKKAFEILDREAQHYLGSGVQEPLQIFGASWGGGGIPTIY